MLEVVSDKLRFYELVPSGWAHTVEVSREAPASFVTVWVCSPEFERHPRMLEHVARKPDLDQHDPATFHADDETYAWIEKRYPAQFQRHWRQHYHWRFPEDPELGQVLSVLDSLGDAVSASLREQISTHLQTEAELIS